MKLSLIVAKARNNVIGRNGKLPWHLPKDLMWFKARTTGKCVLMGRQTFESLPKVLDGRLVLVLTRNRHYRNGYAGEWGAVTSLREAVTIASRRKQNLIVAGGSEVYKLALPNAQKMYITQIMVDVDGDTYFPDFNPRNWQMMSCQSVMQDSNNPFAWQHQEWDRINTPPAL